MIDATPEPNSRYPRYCKGKYETHLITSRQDEVLLHHSYLSCKACHRIRQGKADKKWREKQENYVRVLQSNNRYKRNKAERRDQQKYDETSS